MLLKGYKIAQFKDTVLWLSMNTATGRILIINVNLKSPEKNIFTPSV